MGCTTYSIATFVVLGVAATLLIVGISTGAMGIFVKEANSPGIYIYWHSSTGLFDDVGHEAEDYLKATRFMMIIGILSMAAAGGFFIMGLFMKNISRKIIKVLQIAAIFGAVGAITLGLIIYGSKWTSSPTTGLPIYYDIISYTLGYSYFLILTSDVFTVVAGVISVMDMIRGDRQGDELSLAS